MILALGMPSERATCHYDMTSCPPSSGASPRIRLVSPDTLPHMRGWGLGTRLYVYVAFWLRARQHCNECTCSLSQIPLTHCSDCKQQNASTASLGTRPSHGKGLVPRLINYMYLGFCVFCTFCSPCLASFHLSFRVMFPSWLSLLPPPTYPSLSCLAHHQANPTLLRWVSNHTWVTKRWGLFNANKTSFSI